MFSFSQESQKLTFAMSLECPKSFEPGGDFINLSLSMLTDFTSCEAIKCNKRWLLEFILLKLEWVNVELDRSSTVIGV